MSMREYRIQLKSMATLASIIAAGGICFVAQNGTAVKQTLYNKDGSALANPVTPTRGFISFYVTEATESVDLYILAPGGEFVVAKGMVPSGPNEILVDTSRKHHVMYVPYSVADQAGNATETDSGFTVPANALMLPHAGVLSVVADAAITIEVGTMGTSNDPDGFLDAISCAGAAGTITKGSVAAGVDTLGALLKVLDSANSGDDAPEGNTTAGVNSDPISYTLLTAADTAQGFALLPYMIP